MHVIKAVAIFDKFVDSCHLPKLFFLAWNKEKLQKLNLRFYDYGLLANQQKSFSNIFKEGWWCKCYHNKVGERWAVWMFQCGVR